jgi:predicted dehydrogenase
MEKGIELKVGIAGYGVVGQRRRQFIDSHPRLRTIAVCDQVFREPGELPGEVRCWTNYRQLLEEPLDLLFVCLPNYLAAEVTIAGLEKGLHVFCEKPPGRDLLDIVSVRECEKRHPGQKLMYGFNHRYHDSIHDALHIIQSGQLGKVIDMRGVYGKSKIISYASGWRAERKYAGGGILLDQGIHMVDLMRLFAGDFVEVTSYISNDYWKHDVEDNAYVMMRTSDGVVAFLQSSATQWRHRFQLDITLARGAIILSGFLTSTKSYGAETITVIYSSENDGGDPKEQMTRYNEDHSWRDEVFDFAEAILNDGPIVFGSSAEALKTMHLVYRIYCADDRWKRKYGLSCDIPEGIG